MMRTSKLPTESSPIGVLFYVPQPGFETGLSCCETRALSTVPPLNVSNGIYRSQDYSLFELQRCYQLYRNSTICHCRNARELYVDADNSMWGKSDQVLSL